MKCFTEYISFWNYEKWKDYEKIVANIYKIKKMENISFWDMKVFFFLIFIMFPLWFLFSLFSSNDKKEELPSSIPEVKILWTGTWDGMSVTIIKRSIQETKWWTVLVIPMLPFSFWGEKIWVTHTYILVSRSGQTWEEKIEPYSQGYASFINNLIYRLDTVTAYQDIRTSISWWKHAIAAIFLEKIDTNSLTLLAQILQSANSEIEEKVGISLVGVGSKDAEKYQFSIDSDFSWIYLDHWKILDRRNISNYLIFQVSFRDVSVTEREKYRIIENLETTAVGLSPWKYDTSTYFVQTMSADPSIFLSFHVARPPALSTLGLTLWDPIWDEDHKKSIEFIKNLQLWENAYGESSREVLENLWKIQENIKNTLDTISRSEE